MDEHPPLSSTERIAADLRNGILRGRYQAGDRLPSERELAERFETHRGAVREALKKLEQLGLADIKPGGARAAPIEEASLDIVTYMIELDEIPDPALVDQMLEAFSGLFSMAGRLAAERADEAQRAQAVEILDRLTEDDLPMADEYTLINALGDLFVEASGNLVMSLMRRSLRTQYLDRIQKQQLIMRPPGNVRAPILTDIKQAIADRDGLACSEAVYALSQALRRNAVAILQARRAEERTEPDSGRLRTQGSVR